MLKRTLRFAALLCAAALPACAQNYFAGQAQSVVQVNGVVVNSPAPGAYITVCQVVGTNCQTTTIYSDQALSKPIAQPFHADALGNFGFWASAGSYRYTVCIGGQCHTLDMPSGSGVAAAWGAIAGTIQAQADLVTALSQKQPVNTTLPLTGGTLTGPVVLPADPVAPLQAATKQYVDAHVAAPPTITIGTVASNCSTPSVAKDASSTSTSIIFDFCLPPGATSSSTSTTFVLADVSDNHFYQVNTAAGALSDSRVASGAGAVPAVLFANPSGGYTAFTCSGGSLQTTSATASSTAVASLSVTDGVSGSTSITTPNGVLTTIH